MAELTDDQLLEEEYRRFCRAVYRDDTTGESREPYQWQVRLMLEVAHTGVWPDRIAAPTASGKTCVINIHVYSNALRGLKESGDPRYAWVNDAFAMVPRRLVLTVNRRSLVDDQFEEAQALRDRLFSAADDVQDDSVREVLLAYRKGLSIRSGVHDDSDASGLNVVELRGGLEQNEESRNWRYSPQACAVICATPDMFGSRLLFRGYGTTRAMRPVEAGLFAYDTVLVVDEAHLNRQLVETARQVKRIEAFTHSPLASEVPVLQVVSTTATQAGSVDGASTERIVGVEEADFEVDHGLERRLRNPKAVLIDDSATKRDEMLDNVARHCADFVKTHASLPDASRNVVGCVVDRVSDALEVQKRITRELKKAGINRSVECYLGPMRDFEKRQTAKRLRGYFHDAVQADMSDIPCCIIGTQTLEVGVDVDFCALVTEAASATALIQRAGRVNRRGLHGYAQICICAINSGANDKTLQKEAAPYQLQDVQEAMKWLDTLPIARVNDDVDPGNGVYAQAAHDMSAWATLSCPAPIQSPDRMLFQRLEVADVENLSHTDEDLAADVSDPNLVQRKADIALWLRDNLEADGDANISVAVRRLPADPHVACELLEYAPPVAAELFPVRSRGQLMELLGKENGADKRCAERVFVYKPQADEGERARCFDDSASLQHALVPGAVVVLDDIATAFNESAHVFDPASKERADDVLNAVGSGICVLGLPDANPLAIRVNAVAEAAVETDEDADIETDEDFADEVRTLTSALAKQTVIGHSNPLVPMHISAVLHDDDGAKTWIVMAEDTSMVQSTQFQEIAVNHGKVALQGPDGHQEHVACRAREIAQAIGLSQEFVDALYEAGQYHDEGKKDERFQALLRQGRRMRPGERYLAKSGGFVSRQSEMRYRVAAQLRGWRHEQRSVAEYLSIATGSAPRDDYAELADDFAKQRLAARLIGTSHGHGRSSFAHTEGFLIPNENDGSPEVIAWAKRLYDTGEWETLVDISNQEYGFWGIAYLEALLRSADITVSMEGR